MGKVISVRIDKNLETRINRVSKELKEAQSEVIRNLLNNGSIYLAIKRYADGKFSIGKAAFLANLPLSEFMDLITELGIKSKISKEDLIEGHEYLKAFF